MEKKNVRQVGQIRGNQRIYIEDYAMTYLKRLADGEVAYSRLAVLVGELEKADGKEKTDNFYIYGVLDIPSGEKGLDFVMNADSWNGIYNEMNRCFPKQEILGWYLAGEEPEIERNEKLRRFHRDNFPGEQKLFFYYNPAELEEEMYVFRNGQMEFQGGYYIFYERNEAMQNLLVEKKQKKEGKIWDVPSRETYDDEEKDEGLESLWKAIGLNQENVAGKQASKRRFISEEKAAFRKEAIRGKTMQPAMKKNPRLFSYLAGVVTAVAILMLCLVSYQYFGRLHGLEETIRQMTETNSRGSVLELETLPGGIVEESDDTEPPLVEESQKEKMEELDGNELEEDTLKEEELGEKETERKERETEEKETEEKEIEEKEAEENETGQIQKESSDDEKLQTETAHVQNSYVVQPGDTLIGICRAHYQDLSMMEAVMEANHISNPDGILAGDILILP